MLAVLSPAKNITAVQNTGVSCTRPVFSQEAAKLAEMLRQYAPWQLESLMKLNPELAMKAYANFQAFDPDAAGSPAVLSYSGLAYQYLAAGEFTPQELESAQKRLRIFSALYGLLTPFDGIMPYRLDFFCRPGGQNLYQYWGNKVYQELFASTHTVVNLASAEYAKLFLPYLQPKDRVFHCEFMVVKRGSTRVQATWAKMARGRMARFIVRNRLGCPEDLKEFNDLGFVFSSQLSTGNRFVFLQQGEG